jgi:DinB superfamily
MKTLITHVVIAMAISTALHAQAPANPVVTSAKEITDRQTKFIIAAAEQMPADKYSFQPTPAQWTFGKAIAHLVDANTYVCGMLLDTPPTGRPTPTKDTDPKDVLVTELKASFAVCDKAFATLTDAKLGDTITFFGGKPAPRARALIEVVGDLEDHYSQLASYLRLNDLIPPSAAPKK